MGGGCSGIPLQHPKGGDVFGRLCGCFRVLSSGKEVLISYGFKGGRSIYHSGLLLLGAETIHGVTFLNYFLSMEDSDD